MRADGLDVAVLDMDPDKPMPGSGGGGDKGSGGPLKDDPKYQKYFKMIAMHMPRGAVEQKMRADGLDVAVLDMDPDKPMPGSKNDGGAEAASTEPEETTNLLALAVLRVLNVHREVFTDKSLRDQLAKTKAQEKKKKLQQELDMPPHFNVSNVSYPWSTGTEANEFSFRNRNGDAEQEFDLCKLVNDNVAKLTKDDIKFSFVASHCPMFFDPDLQPSDDTFAKIVIEDQSFFLKLKH